MSKLGFVYETTNNLNGKKYIGSHIGDSKDIYWGSGVDFKKDFNQLGAEHFTRKILAFASDIESLRESEEKFLTEVDAKNNTLYYNRTNSASGVSKKESIRTDCPVCKERPVAINCIKNGTTYYRKLCDICTRLGKSVKHTPGWALSGYKKKHSCEKCGFKSKLPSKQITVFHIDGNLKNNNWVNLRSVCLNCRAEIMNSPTSWKEAPIVPDF